MKVRFQHFLCLFFVFLLSSVPVSADETKTEILNEENTGLLPAQMPFCDILGLSNMEEIAYGTIVYTTQNTCADIESTDLNTWLQHYWDFSYDRVIGPMVSSASDMYYIKLWNADRTKSYTVYQNSGIIAGSLGTETTIDGNVKSNYVWYLPYVGNARNALYTANTELYEKYAGQTRPMEEKDQNDLPSATDDLLVTDGCSAWAETEIRTAAAQNLLLYELTNQYTQNITRLDFSKLACRLIATKYAPESDSRTGIWFALENVKTERNLTEAYEAIAYTDCGDDNVKFLSAAGILNGMGDGTFAPNSPITREQAAAILWRMAQFFGYPAPDISVQTDYLDQAQIADWAMHSVQAVSAMQIMQGDDAGYFSPKNFYSVEQSIATMVRLFSKITA